MFGLFYLSAYLQLHLQLTSFILFFYFLSLLPFLTCPVARQTAKRASFCQPPQQLLLSLWFLPVFRWFCGTFWPENIWIVIQACRKKFHVLTGYKNQTKMKFHTTFQCVVSVASSLTEITTYVYIYIYSICRLYTIVQRRKCSSLVSKGFFCSQTRSLSLFYYIDVLSVCLSFPLFLWFISVN